MTEARMDNPADAFKFMMAGKATVTIKSLASGEHLTFIVKKPRKVDYGISHFVQVRTGNDYARLGMIRDNKFLTMRRADLPATDKRFVAFQWAFSKLACEEMPKQCEIWHEGKCGACNRPLTDPASIARGIGPECLKKVK